MQKLYKIIYPDLGYDLEDNQQFICEFNHIDEIAEYITEGVFILTINKQNES